jgi:2-dehydro-3-deoxyphosphogluconate aldolase/(4S)-4-hydroxy-2-oxoglutarate aldolase
MNTYLDQKRRIRSCGVIPVLTIDKVSDAVPVTQALIDGGLDVIEVTLRTPVALEVISEIAGSGLNCFVGAGTITTDDDVDACVKAGAEFLVSPATPEYLVPALADFPGLVIPGASTPTEALSLYEKGFDHVKFFPAEAAGGIAMLKALSSPLPAISFMPTGGVSLKNLSEYLSLENVVAAGGSWLCTKEDLETSDWEAIHQKATKAAEIVKNLKHLS